MSTAEAIEPAPRQGDVVRLAIALGIATVALYALPLSPRGALVGALKDLLVLAAFALPLWPLWHARARTQGGESVSWALLFVATLMGLFGHVAWMVERMVLAVPPNQANVGIAQGGYMAWIMLMGIALTLEVSSGGRQGMRAELIVDLLLVGTIGFILASEVFRILPLMPESVRPEDMVVGATNLIAALALAVATLGLLMSPGAMGGGVPRLMIVFGAFAAAVARVVFAYELVIGDLNRWLEPVWVFSLLIIAAAAAERVDGFDELRARRVAGPWSPLRTLIVSVIIAYALALLVREILGGGQSTGQQGLTWGLLALLIVARVATALMGSERQAQEVAAWEQRYATVVKALGEVVYEWNPQTNQVLRSGDVKKVFGRDLEELAPSAHQALDLMHAEDRQPTVAAFREATRKGGWFEVEYRIRHASGDWRRIRDRGFCLKDRAGETVRVLGVMSDISEAREGEERLRRAERLAALGGLAAGAAHEINNPLAAIQLAAQMLQEDPRLPDDVKEDVRVIERQATRAGEVTDRMLVFARRKEGVRAIARINEIVQEVLKGRRYDLETHGIRLAVELGDELPEVYVDNGQIERAVLNLVINAERALHERPEGDRHLTVRTRRGADGVFVEVIDDGPGVPLDVLPYIFDPFFTTREVGEGTGLGLSVTYSIVQEHDGDLRVETRPDGGTSFTISLPEAPADARQRALAAAEAEELARMSGEWRPLRVLVVDDEPAVLELTRRFLEGKGHLVDEAESGRHALRLVTDNDYHSIVLDLRMPDLSGEGLYEWIKKNRPELAARVTVITGDYANPATTDIVERMECPWLQKPFDLNELLDMVERTARAIV